MVAFVGRTLLAHREAFARWWVLCGCHDSGYFHNDCFPELLVFAIRTDGVDARPTAQVRAHEWSRQGNQSQRALEPARRSF
jgi:hypothetical protein